MATLTLTVINSTTGILADGTEQHTITGTDLNAVRKQVKGIAADYAAHTGEETLLIVHEGGQVFQIKIGTNGKQNLSPAEASTKSVAAHQVTMSGRNNRVAYTPEPPQSLQAPSQQVLISERQITAPEPIHLPSFSHHESIGTQTDPRTQITEPDQNATWMSQNVFEFDESDPFWQAEKDAPAREGSRGRINSLFNTKIAPGQEELDTRRQAFIDREIFKARERARNKHEETVRNKRQAERQRAKEEKKPC